MRRSEEKSQMSGDHSKMLLVQMYFMYFFIRKCFGVGEGGGGLESPLRKGVAEITPRDKVLNVNKKQKQPGKADCCHWYALSNVLVRSYLETLTRVEIVTCAGILGLTFDLWPIISDWIKRKELISFLCQDKQRVFLMHLDFFWNSYRRFGREFVVCL